MYRWDNVEDDTDRGEPKAPAPEVSRASYFFAGWGSNWPDVTVYVRSAPQNIAQSIVNAFCKDPDLDHRLGFEDCFNTEQFIRNNPDCTIIYDHDSVPTVFKETEYRYDFDGRCCSLDFCISVSRLNGDGDWEKNTMTLWDFLIENGFEDIAREIDGLQPTI